MNQQENKGEAEVAGKKTWRDRTHASWETQVSRASDCTNTMHTLRCLCILENPT